MNDIVRYMSIYHSFNTEKIASQLKALSNPNRLRIFTELAANCTRGEACDLDSDGTRCCVGDLGEQVDVSQSTLSHHIKELRQSGLINVERQGQRIEVWANQEAVSGLADFFLHASSLCARGPDGAQCCAPDEPVMATLGTKTPQPV